MRLISVDGDDVDEGTNTYLEIYEFSIIFETSRNADECGLRLDETYSCVRF